MKKANQPVVGIFAVLFVLHVLLAPVAKAFIASEEEIWKADIAEAKRRAADFKDHVKREREAEEERERLSYEKSEERAQEAKAYDKVRQAYVAERDSRPDHSLEKARLEREDEEKKAGEDREMEASRRAYVVNRARVRDVISREAHIDEMVEYELVKSPETK